MSYDDITRHPFMANVKSWDAHEAKVAKSHPKIMKYINANYPTASFERAKWSSMKRLGSKILRNEVEEQTVEFQDLDSIIKEICDHLRNSEPPDVAQREIRRWQAKMTPEVEEFFEHWDYIGEEALKLETKAWRIQQSSLAT